MAAVRAAYAQQATRSRRQQQIDTMPPLVMMVVAMAAVACSPASAAAAAAAAATASPAGSVEWTTEWNGVIGEIGDGGYTQALAGDDGTLYVSFQSYGNTTRNLTLMTCTSELPVQCERRAVVTGPHSHDNGKYQHATCVRQSGSSLDFVCRLYHAALRQSRQASLVLLPQLNSTSAVRRRYCCPLGPQLTPLPWCLPRFDLPAGWVQPDFRCSASQVTSRPTHRSESRGATTLPVIAL